MMPLRRQTVLALVLSLLVLFVPRIIVAEGFRLGVINERADKPDHALSQFGLLHAYLAGKLAARGVAVDGLVVARSIGDMVDLVNDGAVDAVIEGVMPTLAIERRTGRLQPALLVWRKGQREYHSVFFVRRDSPFFKLADLRGEVVAFEAPRSTSAYFVPRAALERAGLTLVPAEAADGAARDDALRYVFAGSELNQADWVHQGRADVGAYNDGDWDRVPDIIKGDLHIIYRTRPLLRWLMSFRDDLDPSVRSAVTEVLVAAQRDPRGREALAAAERIRRFERLSEADRAGLGYWLDVLKSLE